MIHQNPAVPFSRDIDRDEMDPYRLDTTHELTRHMPADDLYEIKPYDDLVLYEHVYLKPRFPVHVQDSSLEHLDLIDLLPVYLSYGLDIEIGSLAYDGRIHERYWHRKTYKSDSSEIYR